MTSFSHSIFHVFFELLQFGFRSVNRQAKAFPILVLEAFLILYMMRGGRGESFHKIKKYLTTQRCLQTKKDHKKIPLYIQIMFLSLLETIHNSHLLVTAVIAMVGISGIGMYYHWIRLLQFTSMSSVPDMKFRFSPGELNVFFHRLGPRGSEAYQGFCTWDLYPFNWHALVVSFDFGRWQLQIPQDEETISIDLVVPSHGLIRLRRNGDSLLRRDHLSRRVRSQIGSNGKSRQSR